MSKDLNFAQAIVFHLKDQEVEVYSGDNGETHHFSETENTQKNIIRGVVSGATGDCLIIKVKKGIGAASVYLNTWTIKSVVPVSDPLFMKDVYDDEEAGLKK